MTGLLPAWMDPNGILRDPALAPWLVLVMCAFLFVETGLLVGFFLPGDSLLFTSGLLAATGTIQVPIGVLAGAAFLAAFGDQTWVPCCGAQALRSSVSGRAGLPGSGPTST